MTNRALLNKIVASVFVAACYLVFWEAYSPTGVKTELKNLHSKTTSIVEQSAFCSSGSSVVAILPFGFELLLLLWGVSLCVQTADISSGLAETKSIAFSIYNSTFVATLCLVIMQTIEMSPTSIAAIAGFATCYAVVALEIAIYLPKLQGRHGDDQQAALNPLKPSKNKNQATPTLSNAVAPA
jgi:hypothetical protein